MKLLATTLMGATLATLLLTGCGNDLKPTSTTNPDGSTTTVSVDSKQLKQGVLKTTAKDGSVQSEVTYKDDKIVSGFTLRTDSYTVRGKDLTAQVKDTYENGKVVKTENQTDLSHEHSELMYRFGNKVVLDMKYPSQNTLSNALLTMPQLLTQIKNPPFDTSIKVIEAYKGNVSLNDIKFSKLSEAQLTKLYEVGKKFKKQATYLKYVQTQNPELAKTLK